MHLRLLRQFLRATRAIALLLVACLLTAPMAWSQTLQTLEIRIAPGRAGHSFSLLLPSYHTTSCMIWPLRLEGMTDR